MAQVKSPGKEVVELRVWVSLAAYESQFQGNHLLSLGIGLPSGSKVPDVKDTRNKDMISTCLFSVSCCPA